MKLDLPNTGTILSKCINGDDARPRLTGSALSMEMKEREDGNNGGLQDGLWKGNPYVVLLSAIIGAL